MHQQRKISLPVTPTYTPSMTSVKPQLDQQQKNQSRPLLPTSRMPTDIPQHPHQFGQLSHFSQLPPSPSLTPWAPDFSDFVAMMSSCQGGAASDISHTGDGSNSWAWTDELDALHGLQLATPVTPGSSSRNLSPVPIAAEYSVSTSPENGISSTTPPARDRRSHRKSVSCPENMDAASAKNEYRNERRRAQNRNA